MADKMTQDDAYRRLLDVARNLSERLEVALGIEDFVPAFKAKVIENGYSAVAIYKELKPQLPEPSDASRKLVDKNGDRLGIYFSGNGQLSFVWRNADNKAYGRKATIEEARLAIALEAKKYDNWILIEEGHSPTMLPPVGRVGKNALLFEGGLYTYTQTTDSMGSKEPRYEFFNATEPYAGKRVEHIGTLPMLKCFLEKEKLFPTLVEEGDTLITRRFQTEFKVTNVVDNVIFYKNEDNEDSVSATELFEEYIDTRLEALRVDLIAESIATFGDSASRQTVPPSDTAAPAP